MQDLPKSQITCGIACKLSTSQPYDKAMLKERHEEVLYGYASTLFLCHLNVCTKSTHFWKKYQGDSTARTQHSRVEHSRGAAEQQQEHSRGAAEQQQEHSRGAAEQQQEHSRGAARSTARQEHSKAQQEHSTAGAQ